MGGVVFHDEQARMLPLELLVNAADDVHDLGNHAAHQIQRPLFQCLAHDGVVGVGEGLLSDIEGVVKAHALQHQQADQLGDGHGGMGVVELDGVQLEFQDEALETVARKSLERKTGARGLRAIMEHTLMDLMYKTPSDDTIRKCIVTKEAVEGTGEPEIIHGEAKAPAKKAGRKTSRSRKKGKPETA